MGQPSRRDPEGSEVETCANGERIPEKSAENDSQIDSEPSDQLAEPNVDAPRAAPDSGTESPAAAAPIAATPTDQSIEVDIAPTVEQSELADGAGETLLEKLLDRLNPLFLATVAAPTLAATLYFGFLASDVYISQSQFVVRSPDKPAASGIGVLLKSVGFSNAGDEIYITQDFVLSRDALRSLNERGEVQKSFGDPTVSIFDRFDPLGLNGTFEDLFEYYQKMVTVEHDTSSSITTLTVRAYAPQDAKRMNAQLLDLAEGMVNRLNNRGEFDLLGFAQREVREAETAARRASEELAAFRNAQGIIDPEGQAKLQLQLVSKLQDELIANRLQLQQLQVLAPENPQVPLLRTRMVGLARQIDAELGRVTGGRQSLSANAVRYQRLALDRDYADKRLTAALASLQEARDEARRKHAYVERIVEPNLPDEALRPRRTRGIIATFIMGLIAYGIASMLLAGVREHRD